MAITALTKGNVFTERFSAKNQVDKRTDTNSSEFIEQLKEHEVDHSNDSKEKMGIYARKQNGMSAPYGALADENGIIEYNGAVFQCDFEHNTISIGDCSPGANVLIVSLPDSGGCLLVNRDNIGQLMDAITMFSPRDRWAIIRAVSRDSYCERIKEQIDEESDFSDFSNDNFSNTETTNYLITRDPEKGYITVSDKNSHTSVVIRSEEDLKVQTDQATGNRLLINDYGNGFYRFVQVTDELETALKETFKKETLEETALKGFSIRTDEKTGIQYMTANGYEHRGGSLLLDDEGRKKLMSLAEKYLASYPNQISTMDEALTYAAFEIAGLLELTEDGFEMTGQENPGEEEEEVTKQEIIVKADGSRVLMMTMKVGGMQTMMSIELTPKNNSKS